MTGNFFYSIHTLCGEFTCQSNYIQIALLIIPYNTVTTRAHNVCNIWIDISSTNVLYILYFFTESCINVTSTVSSREQPRSWCRLTCLQIRECLCFSSSFYSCSDSTWIWIYKQINFFNKCRYIAIQNYVYFTLLFDTFGQTCSPMKQLLQKRWFIHQPKSSPLSLCKSIPFKQSSHPPTRGTDWGGLLLFMPLHHLLPLAVGWTCDLFLTNKIELRW